MSAAPDKLLDKTILAVDVVLSDSGVLNEPCLLEVNFADESFNGPECFNFHRFVSLFTWMSLSDQACAFGRESVRNSADKWLLGRQITLKTKTMCVFKLIKTLAKHSPKRLGIARRHAQL